MGEIRSDTQTSEVRKKRVKRIKKFLIITWIILLITPIICSVLCMLKVNSIEGKMLELVDSMIALESRLEIMEKDREEVILSKVTESNILLSTKEEEPLEESLEESVIDNPQEVRKVYLTFDDGPSSMTLEILDILKRYNVKATFFVNGKEGEEAQALYQKIVDEGHTLGLHSYSHDYDIVYESVEAYATDLKKLQDYLYEVTGVRSTYVRFPGGSSNTKSDISMLEFIDYLESQGMVYYDWNLSSGDASNSSISVDNIVDNCTNNIINFQTSIILMHDASNKVKTIEALPEIIETINLMDNVEILPITEDTNPIQHIKNND